MASTESPTPTATPTNNTNNNNNNNETKSEVKSTDSNVSRDNMRLHRLARSIKNTKRPDATKPIIEGWLKHTTLSDERARQHYWRLDDTAITLYESDTSKRYFKAIPLSTITRVMSARSLPKSVREDLLTSNVLVNSAVDAVAHLYFATLGFEKLTSSPAIELCSKIRDSCRKINLSPLHNKQTATTTTTTTDQQQQQQQNSAASTTNTKLIKSANTSPTKSPELQAQMNAIFAFEQATGSMYLVQAQSESEASKWREQLAVITMSKRLDEGKGLILNEQQQQQQSPPSKAANIQAGLNRGAKDEELLLMDDQVVVQAASTTDNQVQAAASGAVSLDELPIAGVSSSQKSIGSSSTTTKTLTDNAHSTTTSITTSATTTTSTITTPTTKSELDKSKPPIGAAAAAAAPIAVAPAPNTISPEEKKKQQAAAAAAAPTPAPQRPPQRQHHHHYPPSSASRAHRTYTDPNRSRLYNRPRITIKLDAMSIPDHWIEGKYLIERDRVKGVGFEELGSGQFGKVYAAISEWKAEDTVKGLWSGVPVAIKEISKARFDLRQQAKLKNEANILSRLDHPGVIILERVHDLPDKIYIVMEQLEDDMLEMIVSTEEKRLNERITKFLTYQILEALKYLHAQNIAHCDLKPENVLLVERRSQFPQIKLCDFGFAKIIEENSFRSSLVGTPAYLAPEVVKGERYNRSVDLWSVGVIVYVSLSGEFPFNEGENIHDQISRATFMWPDQPWAKLSPESKSFINSLLRVNCEKRLSASRAQMDEWIQDYTLWCDLSELEVRVGKRWVTDDADYDRWTRYAKKHNLQVPRAAVQLHEELLAD